MAITGLNGTIWQFQVTPQVDPDHVYPWAVDFTVIKKDGTVFPDLNYLGFGTQVNFDEYGINRNYYPKEWISSSYSYGYKKQNYGTSTNSLWAPSVSNEVKIEEGDFIIFAISQQIFIGYFTLYRFNSPETNYQDTLQGADPVYHNHAYDNDLIGLMGAGCTGPYSYYPPTLVSPEYSWKIVDSSRGDFNRGRVLPIDFKVTRGDVDCGEFNYLACNMLPRFVNGVWDGTWENDGLTYNCFYCYKEVRRNSGLYEPAGRAPFLILEAGDKITFSEKQYPDFFIQQSKIVFDVPYLDQTFVESFFIADETESGSFCKKVAIDEPLKGTVWTINKNATEDLLDNKEFYFAVNHYLNGLESQRMNLAVKTEYINGSFSPYLYSDSKELTITDTIYIKDGIDCDDLTLIDWLNKYAVAKDKVKAEFSTIDFDDEWSTNDCHFEYNKYSDIKLDIYSGNIYDGDTLEGFSINSDKSRYFLQYQVGNLALKTISGLLTTPSQTLAPYSNPINSSSALRLRDRYNFCLTQAKINDDYTQQELFGQLDKVTKEVDVTIYYSAPDENGWTVSAQKTFKFPLCIAPDTIPLDSFTQSKVAGANNGDKILYYWETPTDPENDISLAGYCVEVERKVENNWEKIRGLTFDNSSYSDVESIDGTIGITSYELLLDPDYKNPFEEAVPESIDKTFVSPSRNPRKDCEAYLTNYYRGDYHSFYFVPKNIGLNRGEEFRLTIYPYVKYSQYWDENGQLQQSALLTNAGTTLGDGKISKGTVRVYYNDGWKEGQVWVYTSSGWKQAEGVYTKTADGWKEAR